ncbi:MAG: SCO family protein [Candidatus Rokubacteria bacterium]|nr:SCO family protein [Candidatus Rokubacteria bacterium]
MTRAIVFAAALAAQLIVAVVASAQSGSGHHHPAEASAGAEAKSVTVKLLDLELLDQDGKRVRFKSDVVRDRLVVVNVIYTTCPVVCPILSSVFANLQEPLGERLGKEVVLVSISVDPLNDIPPRLKEYAKRFNARPGWVFLTGSKGNVDEMLRGLNMYAADFSEHTTSMLVGDGREGRWRRLYDVPPPDRVLAELGELTVARGGEARPASHDAVDHGGHRR